MSNGQNDNSVGDVRMPRLQLTVAGMGVKPEHSGGLRAELAPVAQKPSVLENFALTVRLVSTVFVGVFLLSACTSPVIDERDRTKEEMYAANVGIVNHMEKYIYSTTVNGAGGGHAHPLSAGVGSMCCVDLPKQWYSGLKVEVGWDVPDGITHIRKSKIVEVEKYKSPGTLYLHFFSDDSVRVVVTNSVGASPNHPIAPPPGAMMRLY